MKSFGLFPSLLLITPVLISITAYLLLQKITPGFNSNNQDRTSGKFEPNWSRLIAELGPDKAYQKFKETNISERSEAHLAAHRFGKILYKYAGKDGVLICDDDFSYGCYHGFFESAVSSEGTGIIEKLDDLCSKRYGNNLLGCQHGIGHGILEYMGHNNLVGALDICRKIARGKYLGCLSGVFMEYNFPIVINGENMIFTKRSLRDKYYPCSEIPDDFKKLCYFEQPQLWTSEGHKNYEDFGELCMQLPQNEYRNICFRGIGNATGKDTNFMSKNMEEYCNLMPDKQSQSYCFAGASWSLLIRKEHTEEGKIFCNRAPDKQLCDRSNDLTRESF